LIKKLGNKLKNWLKGQIIGVVFIGVLSAIGLLILGIPLVFTLALIAGLMNFIPNFGPIIALVPAVLLGLSQGPDTALYIAIIYTGIQLLQTALFRPFITKKMVDVPPALIIIGQITMGALGGFWGVLLATPVVLVIMILVNELYVKNQSYHKYELKEE
jgi:predicted PurR-regulated permease PerM